MMLIFEFIATIRPVFSTTSVSLPILNPLLFAKWKLLTKRTYLSANPQELFNFVEPFVEL